jgi:glycine cleavage system H protein
MSKILNNLKYSKTHEWVKTEGNVAVMGITDYAQHSLGSIVYLEANEIGETVKQFGACGVVESVKAASDIMSPVSGEIMEVNGDAIDNPEKLNEDPYGMWIIKIRMTNEKELNNLLDAKQYEAECK